MKLSIVILNTNKGYKAFVTFNNLTDVIEHETADNMRRDLHYCYGVECSYNESTGELRALTN